MRDRTRRSAGERGAALVEFAFVIPIMLAFVMGLATFGLAEAGDNTGSSAAREGARVGVLRYENAHVPGSPANDAIRQAVDRHMGSGFVSNPSVTVRCVRPGADGSVAPVAGTGSCAPNVVARGTDLIEVRVEWDPIGPVVRPRRSELARTTIVGLPTLSGGATPAPVDDTPVDDSPVEEGDEEAEEPVVEPPPPECVIEAVTLDPNPVRIKVNQGRLHQTVVYRAETNGAPNCGEVTFHWPQNTHGEATTAPDPVPGDDAYIGSLPAGTGDWTLGPKAVQVVAANGATLTFQFDAVRHNA